MNLNSGNVLNLKLSKATITSLIETCSHKSQITWPRPQRDRDAHHVTLTAARLFSPLSLALRSVLHRRTALGLLHQSLSLSPSCLMAASVSCVLARVHAL